jgi:hypothetical protein
MVEIFYLRTTQNNDSMQVQHELFHAQNKHARVFALTSPKAPLPMIVKSSKSSTQILCLFNRIYSVSFLSKSLMRLTRSSVGTSEEANFLSKIQRLQKNKIFEDQKQNICIRIDTVLGKCISMVE